MNSFQRYRNQAIFIAGLVLPLAIVAIMVPFRSNFADPAAALVLVAVIVAVAVVGNRGAGFVATVSATVWFDLFLTRPYERFAITHRPDIETTVSLFVVGVVVTELAARNRRHREIATEESDYVGLIHRISELAVSGARRAWSSKMQVEYSAISCICGRAVMSRGRRRAPRCRLRMTVTSSLPAPCGRLTW